MTVRQVIDLARGAQACSAVRVLSWHSGRPCFYKLFLVAARVQRAWLHHAAVRSLRVCHPRHS